MRITQPVYKRNHGNDSEGQDGLTRSLLAQKERITPDTPTQLTVWRRKRLDGSKILVRSITRAGDGVLPIRLTSVVKSTEEEGESEETLELFLESAWVTATPGETKWPMWYSPHLETRYDDRATSPAYLDWMYLPGRRFEVRDYTAWMDDEVVFNSQGVMDVLHVTQNHYNHGSTRLGLFTNCLLGSNFDPSAFLTVLEEPSTTVLSHLIYVDESLDYYFVRITKSVVQRAKITWWPQGTQFHAMLKGWAGGRINRWSTAHKLLRRDEQYLFATARGIEAWETLGTHTVDGYAPWYGWNPDWDGENAVHVTTEQDPVEYAYEINGIRFRLYELSIGESSTSLTKKEDVLATPDRDIFQLYHPNVQEVNGRMQYWYFLDKHQTYAKDLSGIFPLAAAYKALEDDPGYFVIHYDHAAEEFIPGEGFTAHLDAAGRFCSSAVLPMWSAGDTNVQNNGFILVGAPNGGTTVSLDSEHGWRGLSYEVSNVEVGTSSYHACVVSGSFLGAWSADPNYWPTIWNGLDSCCPEHPGYTSPGKAHDISCGNVIETTTTWGSRNRLYKTALAFNFGAPDQFSIITVLYDRETDKSVLEKTDFDGPIAWSGTCNGYYWNRAISSRFPGLHAGTMLCPSEDPSFQTPCENGAAPSNPVTTNTIPATSTTSIRIKHILVTPTRTQTIHNKTYEDWADIGNYDSIYNINIWGASPYQYLDFMLWSREGVENYIASGDLISDEIVTDMSMPDPTNHEGFLTIPVGGA